jgi:hypothetical protein
MINEFPPAEEELVLSIAELPPLPADLRDRVLDTFHRKCRVRAVQRRVASAAGLLVLFVALLPHLPRPFVPVAAETGAAYQHRDMQSESDTAEVTDWSAGLSAVISMSEIGDWGHVEAVIQLRKMNRQALGSVVSL